VDSVRDYEVDTVFHISCVRSIVPDRQWARKVHSPEEETLKPRVEGGHTAVLTAKEEISRLSTSQMKPGWQLDTQRLNGVCMTLVCYQCTGGSPPLA
jgi:hypothetical protein